MSRDSRKGGFGSPGDISYPSFRYYPPPASIGTVLLIIIVYYPGISERDRTESTGDISDPSLYNPPPADIGTFLYVSALL